MFETCLLAVVDAPVAVLEPASQHDRGEVQHDDDEYQQQRGGIHEGPGGLDVGALEADVVDVEAEVHELALEVHVREVAVDREGGCQLHDPDQHQRRHLARGPRNGQDHAGEDRGTRHRQDDLEQGFGLGGAECKASFAQRAGDTRQALLRGDDDDRQREQREGERGPQEPRCSERGRGQRFGIEELVQRTAQEVDEEAESEDAIDDRRNAGQIVHGDADQPHEGTLAGVFAQVDGGDHAERGHQHRHEEDHHHRAEDRRKDTALGVGFAGILGEEAAERVEVVRDLGARPHGVRLPCLHHLGQADGLGRPVGQLEHDRVAVELGLTRAELLFDARVVLAQPAFRGFDRGEGLRANGGVEVLVQLESAAFQALLIEFVVDAVEFTALEAPQVFTQFGDPVEAALQIGPRIGTGGAHRAVLMDAAQVAVGIAPFHALQYDDVLGITDVVYVVLDDPSEVGSVGTAVARFHQPAIDHGLPGLEVARGLAGRFEVLVYRQRFRLDHFAQHFAPQSGGIGVVDEGDVGRPEVGEAADGDQAEYARDGGDADRHRRGVHPDPGFAGTDPGTESRRVVLHHDQRFPYRVRSRWRTTSATVLKRKVIRNSTMAVRNRIR